MSGPGELSSSGMAASCSPHTVEESVFNVLLPSWDELCLHSKADCSSPQFLLLLRCPPVFQFLPLSGCPPVFQCLPLSRCPLCSRGKAVCPSHLLPTYVSSTKPPPIHSSSLCNKTLPRPSHRQRPPGSQGLHGTQSAVLFSPLLSERLKSKQYFWPLYVNPYFTPEPPYSLLHLYFSVSQQAHLLYHSFSFLLIAVCYPPPSLPFSIFCP